MKRWIATLTACVALVACGLVHGTWTERWKKATGPAEAASRMEQLPLQLGDWQGTVIDVKPESAGEGVAGVLQRLYVHRGTGQSVNITLVCGRPGPVSIHTPDACYGALGFKVDVRGKKELAGLGASFWQADAVQVKASEESRLRIYWGWNAGQGWTAADDSRLQFARYPVLFKLYVKRDVNVLGEKQTSHELCEDFLQVLLPELDRALFAEPKTPAGGAL
jgi:hypothetical protein